MPRSSRHKSHKQHKHSSKDSRDQSDSEEEVNLKERNGKDKALINLPRDSSSSEKRKLSQSRDGDKHLLGPGNGDLSGEHGSSKKRKEKVEGPVADRWNGGEVVDKKLKGETELALDKGSKPKVSVDSKSKSSRRHESYSERKSENSGLAVVESEEFKKSSNSSSKVEEKWKSEKDLGRKEGYQYKEAKEKEHRSEKDKKSQDVKRESKIDALPGASTAKRELENAERQMYDELRNHELEKERDRRIRRRGDSDDNDKYQDDSKDAKDSRASVRDDRTRNGRYKDEKHKEDKHRDRHQEDMRKEHRNRDDKHRDDYLKDHSGRRSESKHSRDEKQSPPKKSKPRDREVDGSPHIDDRVTSFKDNRGKKRFPDDNEDYNDLNSRSTKEHRSVMEKKSMSSSKKESPADRGRSQLRHTDIDSTVSRSRRRSPSPNTHFVKDQSRNSSKAESKYVDSVAEETRSNATPSRGHFAVPGVSERAADTRTLEKLKSKTKTSQEDDNHLAEFSAERSPISDKRLSPALLNEKSFSSTSIDRRYSNRTNVRRSLEIEETGRRSIGFKDAKEYSRNDDRGSRDLPLEKPADDFSQADGDSVSSSFNRTSHFPSSSSSIPPPAPAFRIGVGSPSVMGSSEEDGRGKANIRYRRNGDFNVGRGQGNAWKGIPNWPSPLPNGFMPFQHGPPPGGFHTMMQQFPAPPLFGMRSSMELNHTGVPYHIPDSDRFSAHMHGWDGSNGVFHDESHMYGRPDWDQNRHAMNSRGWEVNSDMWKGQELPTAPEKDDHHLSVSSDFAQQGHRSRNERNRPGFRAESIEVKRSNEILPAKEPVEAPVKRTPEKTPEPTKKLNDNDAPFCHVYLSKLDISEDLTDPELYKQCMSLFDMNGNSTQDLMKHAHLKEPREARLKISNTTLSASLFPTLKDTVLQRAMILYKQRGEEMKPKLPFPSFPGSERECSSTNDSEERKTLSASNGGKLESVPPPVQEITEEPVTPLMMVEELVPARMMVEEPVTARMVVEKPVPARMMVEESDPAQMMVEEPDPARMMVEERVPTRMIVKEPVSAQMTIEEPIPAQMMVVTALGNAEEPVPARTIVGEPVPAQMMVEEPIPAQMMAEEPVRASDQDKAEAPVPASDQEILLDPIPASDQEKAGETVPAPDHEKGEETVLKSNQEKSEDLIPISGQESEDGPTTYSLEVMERVLVPDEEKPKEVVVPTLYHQEKGEAAMNVDQEILMDPIEDQSLQNASSEPKTDEPTNKEAIVISSDSEGNIPTSSANEHTKATNGGTVFGPLGSSEVCEALMPESIECRSLSRIHHSSESTH